MCENKCQGFSNPINVDQAIALVIKMATSLRKMEGDL
jgi:hypothetical protein